MKIDWWTLGMQAINVLVLVWLLGHFFWKPVAAMIEQRRLAAQQLLSDAKTQQDQAAAALVDIANTRAGFAKEREAILADAHAEADRNRAARLEAATKEADAMAVNAGKAAEQQQAAAQDAWRERSARLAVDIAGRLCAPLAGPALQAAFIDRLIETIRQLPDAERQTMAAQGAHIEVLSAAPLETQDQGPLVQRLAEAFGVQAEFVFRTEPALIAGIELHGPHLVVSNSWRADLQHIQTELSHDAT